jgi:hypothetical protein
MNLNAHILNADFSINLPTDIIHFQWDWDTPTLFEEASEAIQELKESGNEMPSLQDLMELKIQKPKTKWTVLKIFVSFICSILALGLVTLTLIIIFLHPKLLNTSIVKLLNRNRPLIEPLTQTNQEEIELNSVYPSCHANATLPANVQRVS